MHSANPHTPAPLPLPPPPEALFDLAAVGLFVGFAQRSIRRHRRLSVLCGVGVTAAAFVAVAVLPRTYYTEAKILAQRNMVMPALGNPRRSVPAESDAPTKLAAEAVLKRENLLGIIRETNLLVEWKAQRVPLLRLKDKIQALVSTPLTKEEELDALVGLLVRRLGVDPQEGTVTIGVRWPNALTAHRIVQAAQDHFLAERHSTEVSLIGESIAILEGHVATTRLDIDSAYAELHALAPTRVRRPVAMRTPPVDMELASQQALLVAKRQALADLTSLRSQRIADIQARLDERSRVLGPSHPEIADLRRSLATASVVSPQIDDLRAEERRLTEDIARRGATPGTVSAPRALSEDVLSVARDIRAAQTSSVGAVPKAEESYATSRLKISLDNYQDLLDRLNSARIELQTARAAFKYRYAILTPGQVPSRPIAPNTPLILAVGVILGACMSVAAPLIIDVLSGRVLESSQIPSSLGLEVLGEIGRT